MPHGETAPSVGVIAIEANLKHITLDLDPDTKRRLMTTAALRGMSLPQYHHAAIDRELASDEALSVPSLPFGHGELDRHAALSKATFGNMRLTGDSTEFIREPGTVGSQPRTALQSLTTELNTAVI